MRPGGETVPGPESAQDLACKDSMCEPGITAEVGTKLQLVDSP